VCAPNYFVQKHVLNFFLHAIGVFFLPSLGQAHIMLLPCWARLVQEPITYKPVSPPHNKLLPLDDDKPAQVVYEKKISSLAQFEDGHVTGDNFTAEVDRHFSGIEAMDSALRADMNTAASTVEVPNSAVEARESINRKIISHLKILQEAGGLPLTKTQRLSLTERLDYWREKLMVAQSGGLHSDIEAFQKVPWNSLVLDEPRDIFEVIQKMNCTRPKARASQELYDQILSVHKMVGIWSKGLFVIGLYEALRDVESITKRDWNNLVRAFSETRARVIADLLYATPDTSKGETAEAFRELYREIVFECDPFWLLPPESAS
jgi:hypothetical protein